MRGIASAAGVVYLYALITRQMSPHGSLEGSDNQMESREVHVACLKCLGLCCKYL